MSPSCRRSVVVALSLLLATSLGCNRVEVREPGATRPMATGPNVLLVTIDTLRADRVGAQGESTAAPTPTLDALAAEGLLYRQALATAPLTLPSHASILTGQYPPKHGVRHNGLFRLGADTATLAERFQTAGWDTGAVIAAVVLDAAYGLDQGFDHYDAEIDSRRAAPAGFHERRAEEVTDAALAWLGSRPGVREDRPFLLWVHYYDPHAVYDPPPPYDERFASDPYAGEIAYVDDQLGRLIEALRASGRLDDTIVAVTADHGESLGEHHEDTHAYTVYDAAMHVPLILRGPGIEPAVSERVVSNIDVAPTLVAMAGLPALPEADGAVLAEAHDAEAAQPGSQPGSLPGSGQGPAQGPGQAYAESLATQIDHGWAPLHALRDEQHLYIRAPMPELYDMAGDPKQLENLLEADPEAHRETIEAYEARLDVLLESESGAESVELDEDTRAQLLALGYALPSGGSVVESGLDPKLGIQLIAPFERAKVEYQEGRIDEALRLAQEVLAAFEASPGTHDLLARIYLSMGQPEPARRHADRALDLAPESPFQHHLVGLTRVATQDYAEAVAAFDRALVLDPGHANSRAGRVWRLRAGGTLEEAIAEAEAAIAIDPMSSELHVLIGDTWDQLGEYERSLARYRAAAELDPGNGHAHLGIAVQTARLGEVADVSRHLVRAGPAGQALGSRLKVAIALATRGEGAYAEQMLRGILQEAPDFDPARRVLAKLLENLGRDAEASAVRAAS